MANRMTGKSIGIIGSGKMGADIFNYLADFDFDLTWVCLGAEEAEKKSTAYQRRLERQRKYGLIDDGHFRAKKRGVNITERLAELSSCDFIIEAITEDEAAKTKLFEELDPLIKQDAVVVSNSSSIKPSRLTANVQRRGRYAGLHFFYPAKSKNIAEVIAADFTSEGALTSIKDFLSSLGRFYLEMHEDEGFILNRIFLDLQSQAYRYYAESILSFQELDSIVKTHLFPVGVFEFFDRVGIDVMLRSVCNYTDGSPDEEFYRPLREGLDRMVRKNRLGQKNGAGFYDYPGGNSIDIFSGNHKMSRDIFLSLFGLYVNSAFRALEKNTFSKNLLEYAIKEYMDLEKGPFELARETGYDKITTILLKQHEITGFEAFKPSGLLTSE